MAYDPTKAKGQTSAGIDDSVLGMPLIDIIQKGSAEFDESHPKHAQKKVEGCKPGSVVFAPERRVLTQPLLVIPVATDSLYTEWRPRSQGGGFVGNRSLAVVTDRAYRKGAPPNENKEFLGDNELIFTIYFMVLFKQGEEWKKGVIAFTGTQLKHGRNWSRLVKQVRYEKFPEATPPVFAAAYQLSTKVESNSKGSWFGWDIRQDHVLDLDKEERLLQLAEGASVDALVSMPKASLPAPAAPVAALPPGEAPY